MVTFRASALSMVIIPDINSTHLFDFIIIFMTIIIIIIIIIIIFIFTKSKLLSREMLI